MPGNVGCNDRPSCQLGNVFRRAISMLAGLDGTSKVASSRFKSARQHLNDEILYYR